jgi:hypothetical protein
VRLSIGCAHDVLLPTAPAEGAPPWEHAAYNAARVADPSEGPPATVCQLFAEVRLALEPPRLQPYASRLQLCALEVAALCTPPHPPPHPTHTHAPVSPHPCPRCALQVRLGREPSKMAAWVRQVLPGSQWLGKAYSYRLDVQGYAWLNLDAIDGHRGQRPGTPYKAFATATTFYPGSLVWEVEGDETDSAGQPRLKHSPHEKLQIGVR